MTKRLCEQVDDYLAEDLSEAEIASFEQHLDECESCRCEVANCRALYETLQEASLQIERPAGEFVQRVAGMRRSRVVRPKQASRRRRMAAAMVACLVVAAFFAAFKRPTLREDDENDDKIPRVTTLAPPADVTLPDDVIGVPIDIGDPNVTVVWIYSTDNRTNNPN